MEKEYYIVVNPNGQYFCYTGGLSFLSTKESYFCKDLTWKTPEQITDKNIYFNSMRNLIRQLKKANTKVYNGFEKRLLGWRDSVLADGYQLPWR